jgi:DNA-binding IclR family transcriptional regulator
MVDPGDAGGGARWSFLTDHARVLVCLADDPEMRLGDIAEGLGVSEHRASVMVNDLIQAGWIVKEREGGRTRYRIETSQSLHEQLGGQHSVGELLALLLDLGGSTS